jgi:hypothetical protein
MSGSIITGRRFGSWIGLLGGALAWAANTQAGQMLPPVDCIGSIRVSAITSFAGAALALAAGCASWFFAGGSSEAAADSTDRFVGCLSLLAALLFTYALALQGLAALVLTGCER